MEKRSILVADDDRDDFNILIEAFKGMNEEVVLTYVSDGRALIDLLAKCKTLPNLIVLDINMPKMSGLLALELLKKEEVFCQIPVVIYSTSSDGDHINKSYLLGAIAFITKPWNFCAIVDVARKLFELATPADHLLPAH